MKPAMFAFRAPETLQGVLAELKEHGEAARILAGGQSLIPLMNLRMLQPRVLVSINHCLELSYIRAEEDALVCGALARQWDVEHDHTAISRCPLLVEALHYVGARSNRNRGTVCGSLAHADPLAELPTVALALEATMVVASASGKRLVKAEDFFVGALENCMRPDEMLEAVRFPYVTPKSRLAFLESGNRKHGFAIAGVAVALEISDDGRCDRARIAVMGGENIARRIAGSEKLLSGPKLDEKTIDEAARLAADTIEVAGDFHADRTYRKELVAVLLERALKQIANGGRPSARMN